MSRVVLVTGGSRGIGAATARLAGQRGYDVCVNYRHDRDAAEAVVAAVRAAGQRAIAVAADVSSEPEVVRLFETVDAGLDPVTALVNNAGVLETQARVDGMDGARLARVFATNVIGPFLCCREAVRRMSTRQGGAGGAIVNVSSRAAQLGSANEYVDYAASKGALDTLTIGLAHEVALEGIRVNAVRPGFIYTAETDPNHLLGQPNGYTSEATFTDNRISAADTAGVRPGSIQRGGSVEVFADASSATIRQQRLGQLYRNAPLLASEYTFTDGPALLRISGRLTPAQAAEYAAAFRR